VNQLPQLDVLAELVAIALVAAVVGGADRAWREAQEGRDPATHVLPGLG